jgi:hypothetical protein
MYFQDVGMRHRDNDRRERVVSFALEYIPALTLLGQETHQGYH